MKYPSTVYSTPSRLFTDSFFGYNHNLKIGDGEWYDTTNLSTNNYPLMSQRPKRGRINTVWNDLQGVTFKDALIYVDGSYVYMNGSKIEGPVLSTADSMQPKQLISMGAYLLIWPDKVYINTSDTTEWGYIDKRNHVPSGSKVELSLCKVDGTAYEITDNTAGTAAPSEPKNGQLWIDTTAETHVLKQWSETTGMWVQVATCYIKISAPGIGDGLKQWDGVTISGLKASDESLSKQVEKLNGSHVLYEVGNGYVVVVGLLDKVVSFTTKSDGEVKAERVAPDMDYITESNNRLWGCYYGVNGEGKTVNEIYCCALGDFKNWTRYLGVSTDSFAASVGTDGQWTGAATYMGNPIFFKESCLHKVYVSTTGAHQIVETQCRGVKKGCGKSLKVVGERLYYLSETGIMRYDGSLPSPIHDMFGGEMYKNAVGGRLLDKYYVSMQDSKDKWHLFVYDTAKGLWLREDETRVKEFAESGNTLYFIDENNDLVEVLATDGIEEESVFWEAISGLLGYEYADTKYVTRINIRAVLPVGSDLDAYIEYDSNGQWEFMGHWEGEGTASNVFAITPARCDHYRIKLNGTGEIKIFSIAKNLDTGSDVF